MSSSPADSEYATLHLRHGADEVADTIGTRKSRFGGAFGTSLLSHVAFFVLLYILLTLPPPPIVSAPERPFDPNQLIWLDTKGTGGGGGGGGNQSPEPPRKLETKGPDKISIPIAKAPPMAPPKEVPKPTPEEPPKIALNVPVRAVDSGQVPMPGALNGSISAPPTSQGSGTGGGAGTGRGTGSGPGEGSGLGPGSGGGTGGGVYQPGNGVSLPQLLYEAKPQYTPDAMRAKLQGEVLLEAVVMPDGTTGNIRVIRSLDSTFGLDQEAIKAVRLWRFRPGMRQGQPVPVLITVGVSFNLR
jgi:periplasmic protein TonB